MYLLDTNIILETRKAHPHDSVAAWLKTVADGDLCISAFSFGKIQMDIEVIRKQDSNEANEFEQWTRLLSRKYKVLLMDAQTFMVVAKLTYSFDELNEDAMIAATAIRYKLPVVTRNTLNFKDFNVDVLNPFEYAG
jgi:predicted nucleic acid-binding protein